MSRSERPRPRRVALLGIVLAACATPTRSFDEQRATDHNRYGNQALRAGDLDTAAAHHERALEAARQFGDRIAEVDALNAIGLVSELRGDPDAALERYEEALLRAAPPGASDPLTERYPAGVWSASLNRSRILLGADRIEDAIAAVEEARRAADRIGSRVTRAAVLKQEALVLRRVGRTAEALERARDALRLYEIAGEGTGTHAGWADAQFIVGRLFEANGDPVRAIGAYRTAADLALRASDRKLRARSFSAIGETLEASGHLDDARIRYRTAYDEFRRLPDPAEARGAAEALVRIAESQQRIDHLEEAERLLEALDSR